MTASFERSDEDALRAEVRRWLIEQWDEAIPADEWRRCVVDAGWGFCTWPREYYGRGVPAELAHVVQEEFEALGARNPTFGHGFDSWAYFMGSTIQIYGSDAMKQGLLRQMARGDMGQGCLFYSEPGAGSDLAGLQTRADWEGDGYRVNGQKVWSSMAATADWGMLIARTNWDVPKHRGISFFLLPVRVEGVLQPGIEIRPIKQITGEAHFNEVFFTDAWVPADRLVGEENEGWRVLQTALTYERLSMGRIYRESAPPEVEPILRGAEDLSGAARRSGRERDPVIRQLVAQLHSWRLVQAWNNQRAAEGVQRNGSLASLSKLANSRILHSNAALLRLLSGPEALLYDYEDLDKQTPNGLMMSAFVNSIGGGSDQIQRNLIGERVLGLPKGPEPTRDQPFRDVPKGVAVRSFG